MELLLRARLDMFLDVCWVDNLSHKRQKYECGCFGFGSLWGTRVVYASRCLFGKKSDRNTKRLGINKILQGVSRRIRPPLPFVVGTAV